MATVKPRITITLDPHRYELLRRMSALRGVSMSTVISELFEAVSEPMERLCVLSEAVKRGPSLIDRGLQATMRTVAHDFERHAMKAIEQHDLFFDLADLVLEVEEDAPRAASRPQSQSVPMKDPRPVITGVRSPVGSGRNSAAMRVGKDSEKNRGKHASVLKRGAKS